MARLAMRRSAHGLDAVVDGWRHRAACTGDSHIIDRAGLGGVTDAGRAAHLCDKHCPVLEPCLADAMSAPADRLLGTVQGGLWWTRNRQGLVPVKAPDPGCGPWCGSARGL